MRKRILGTTLAAAGIAAALTMGGGTAYANGDTVWTNGDNQASAFISSNTITHCLDYSANEHNGWNWGGFRVVDNDTQVHVAGGNIGAFSLDVTGRICGLYGKHYYIQVWGGSGFGSLSN